MLCGCDYIDGVHGVGKEAALKLFKHISDEEILDRLRSWKGKDFGEWERKVSDKNICTSCGHSGKISAHTKSGCTSCKTYKGCDFSKFREQRLEIKNELGMRNKAINIENFPNEELINEFLIRKDNVSKLDLRWKQPNMVKFVVSIGTLLNVVSFYRSFVEIRRQIFNLGGGVCF